MLYKDVEKPGKQWPIKHNFPDNHALMLLGNSPGLRLNASGSLFCETFRMVKIPRYQMRPIVQLKPGSIVLLHQDDKKHIRMVLPVQAPSG